MQEAALRQDAMARGTTSTACRPWSPHEKGGRGGFRPFQEARFAHEWGGGPLGVHQAGLVYWPLVPFAIAGAVTLRRAAVPLLPLLTFVVVVAVVFGAFRFRAPAAVPIVVLAAVGVDALWRSVSGRRDADRRRLVDRPDEVAAEDVQLPPDRRVPVAGGDPAR